MRLETWQDLEAIADLTGVVVRKADQSSSWTTVN
jgi:hypothetical protein